MLEGKAGTEFKQVDYGNDGRREFDVTLRDMQRLAYKVCELPGLLGIGRNKAYELVRDGTIRSIKAGKTRLVPVSAIEAFLAGE